ncbi:MAG: cysteine hydrolase [Desulfobulbaceae bacterium]|nr:cysteine hydrolase [Desulfobulbaceae bacterium]
MHSCLIVIDLQNDYFPGGTMELVGIEAAAANARLLLDRYRETGSTVIHVQHLAVRPGATFFLPATSGAEINELVGPQANEIVVVKNYPNSFRDTPLLEIFKQEKVDHLVICGAMSHMCIDATVRAAFDFGFTCLVAEDACATRDLAFRGRTIKAADVHASFMAALAVPYAKVIATMEIMESRG